MNRVAGVHVIDQWTLRRAAEQVFPGSRKNQKRWMRVYASRWFWTPKIGAKQPPVEQTPVPFPSGTQFWEELDKRRKA